MGNSSSINCHCITLDTSGLRCPEPIMLLHRAIGKIEVHQWILLISTDPTSERDLKHFCKFLHHKLLTKNTLRQDDKDYFIYLIEKHGVSS